MYILQLRRNIKKMIGEKSKSIITSEITNRVLSRNIMARCLVFNPNNKIEDEIYKAITTIIISIPKQYNYSIRKV